MMTEVQKQIMVGGLVGILLCVATYITLGGKRGDLTALEAAIKSLDQEVEKGRQIKANFDKLKFEVDQQNKQLDELIRVMPTELDRGELPIKLKKLADTAGLDQELFKSGSTTKSNASNKEEYYISYPYEFSFRGGYHEFGRFASLISGFDKMVNVMNFRMQRSKSNLYPANIQCTISAFVYNPNASKAQPAAGKPGAAPGPKKGEGD
jgi:Tfp pilus assembly protein PilO